jgi:hypothetical protein
MTRSAGPQQSLIIVDLMLLERQWIPDDHADAAVYNGATRVSP